MNEQFEIWYRLNHSILHVCRTPEQILEEEVRHANCENAWNAALKFAQQPNGENCPHWEKLNSEFFGEYGVCKCAGKLSPHVHICGDPNSPCDCDCADHAKESDRIYKIFDSMPLMSCAVCGKTVSRTDEKCGKCGTDFKLKAALVH